jgi:hypothetical protein
LALFWDKAGLGHNGQRLRDGGHKVFFVRGMSSSRYVTAAEWPAFIEEQKALLAKRSHSPRKGDLMLSAKVRLPGGVVVDRVDGRFNLSVTISGGPDVFYTQDISKPTLEPKDLRWTAFDSELINEGRLTLVLESFEKGWRSKPVTVEIKDGVATPSSIIFEMEIASPRR